MTAKAATFTFATQPSALSFVEKLLKRDYERVAIPTKIGDFSNPLKNGDGFKVSVCPFGAKDLSQLYVAASVCRKEAGEPPRKTGSAAEVEAAKPAEVPSSAPRKEKVKRKAPAPSALKRLVDAAIATPPSTSPLTALIAELEAKRDRFQAAIDGLRTAEKLMAEA